MKILMGEGDKILTSPGVLKIVPSGGRGILIIHNEYKATDRDCSLSAALRRTLTETFVPALVILFYHEYYSTGVSSLTWDSLTLWALLIKASDRFSIR